MCKSPLHGCSPQRLFYCRRGKIKYFSFRSFTPFMSRERDAPESQVRPAQRGEGAARVHGARPGTGTFLHSVLVGAQEPGTGLARAGRGRRPWGEPVFPRGVSPCSDGIGGSMDGSASSRGCRAERAGEMSGLSRYPPCAGLDPWCCCGSGKAGSASRASTGTGKGMGTGLGQGTGWEWAHLGPHFCLERGAVLSVPGSRSLGSQGLSLSS